MMRRIIWAATGLAVVVALMAPAAAAGGTSVQHGGVRLTVVAPWRDVTGTPTMTTILTRSATGQRGVQVVLFDNADGAAVIIADTFRGIIGRATGLRGRPALLKEADLLIPALRAQGNTVSVVNWNATLGNVPAVSVTVPFMTMGTRYGWGRVILALTPWRIEVIVIFGLLDQTADYLPAWSMIARSIRFGRPVG